MSEETPVVPEESIVVEESVPEEEIISFPVDPEEDFKEEEDEITYERFCMSGEGALTDIAFDQENSAHE